MIFNSVILEVAIGLFFVFLLISLLCSEINELIAAVLNLRAKFLQKGIQSIFNENEKLVADFFNSPLVKGLSEPDQGSRWILARSVAGKPSYIPSYVFARVLRDIIVPESGTLPPRSWNEVLAFLNNKAKNEGDNLTPIERELIGVLQTAGVDGNKIETLQALTAELQATRNALHEFATRDSAGDTAVGQFLTEQVRLLEASVQQIQHEFNVSLEQAQVNVERYFNSIMERVNSWYKQRVQLIILVLSALITILFNVDTIAIIDSLMKAPVARAALIDQATILVQDNEEVRDTTAQTTEIAQLEGMHELGLPLGWYDCTLPGFIVSARNTAECTLSAKERSTFGWWVSKISGLAITIAAASLGAPFWFDLLNKIVNLRLSGRRPNGEHSKE